MTVGNTNTPADVIEAIWALMCDGIKTGEIERRLHEGTAGLPRPYPIKRRTLETRKKRLMQERGNPLQKIAPGDEEEAIGSMRRRALELAHGELLAIEEKKKCGKKLTGQDHRDLASLLKTFDDMQRRMDKAAGRSSVPRSTANESRGASSGDLMDRLVKGAARAHSRLPADPALPSDENGAA